MSSRRTWGFVALLAALPVAAYFAATAVAVGPAVEFSVHTAADAVHVTRQDATERVAVDGPGFEMLSDPGLAELPYRVMRVVLPQGYSVDDFEVVASAHRTIAAGVRLIPAGPRVTNEGTKYVGDADPVASAVGGEFPGTRVRYMGTGYLHGYAIAGFAVFPVAVIDDNVVVYEDVSIRVKTRADETIPVVRERRRGGFREAARARVEGMVVNPHDAAGYGFTEVELPEKHMGFMPSIFPSLEGSPVDYVIITNDSLAASLQVLADFKTDKGVPTVVRTTEWIAANYRNGSDLQETIRNFVTDAYAKWGITYVLLAGDTDLVPARLAWTNFYDGGRFLPADMYYGCLDGDWNADHDDIFGEWGVDAPDLYSEVYVSRLPVLDNATAAILVGKVMDYENAVTPDFANRSLFLGEVLFPSDYQLNDPVDLDGANLSEYVRLSHFTAPGLDAVRLYERDFMFPGSFPETKQASVDSLNAGFNHGLHIGHGFRFNMSVADASILNADAAALVNGSRQSNLYLLNCTAVAILFNCLGEEFMRNPAGGAVSVVGANESAFPTTSIEYMFNHYDLLFQQDVTHLSEVLARSREDRTPLALLSENVDFWTHYILTVLGDAEMPLWTNAVDVLSVSHTSSVGLGTTAVTVTVLSGGMPVDSAMVCLSKGDEDYQVGTTDGAGQVTMNFRSETLGTIKVVATGLNHARHESSITVQNGGPAYIAVESLSLDDDSAGGTTGNNDGLVDAGETVDLLLTVKNTSVSQASNVGLVVRSSDPGVTIVDSMATVGTVNAGQTVAVVPLRVQFSSGIADETAVTFTFVFESGGVITYDDFEGGFGSYTDGGADCLLYTGATFAHQGSNAADIQDNSGVASSFYHTNGQDVSGFTELEVEFWYYAVAMENGEDFWVQYYDGSSWQTVASFVAGVDFTNGNFLNETVTISSGVYNFPANAQLRFMCDATADADDIYIDEIEFRGIGTEISRDVVKKVVHAPELSAVTLRIDDTALGNGDGIVDAGEQFRLHYNLKNFGTGEMPAANATITDIDGGFVFSTSSDTWAALPSLQQSENTAGFLITETSVATEHRIGLQITDSYGRAYLDTFELRPPTPPDSLYVDPSLGPNRLRVTWRQSTSLDASHYNVYRSISSGGPYTLGNVDPVMHGVYVDTGLNGTTTYYYTVAAIDRSGNESLISVEYAASTNPLQMTGWPNEMGEETVSSPVVGDIDGDGDREVVVGDGAVYAWHHDGFEVIDGDGDALSWGVLNTTGSNYVSHIALANVDGNPGADIIAASRDTQELYVFNHTGATLPGWPLLLENEIRAGLVAGDIDNDGQVEIIAVDELGVLYVCNRDGSEYRDGDSNPGTKGVFKRLAGATFHYSTPAIGDIDADGFNEIIVGTEGDLLYVLNEDGTSVPGFPAGLGGNIAGSPAVGDLDNDGDPEIVVHIMTGEVRALHHDGSLLFSRWLPATPFFAPSPAIGDVNGNGKLETFVPSTAGLLYGFDHTGSDLPGWPVVYSTITNTESSPIIVDVDGDSGPDVILGNEDRFIMAWRVDGSAVAGFPLTTLDAMRGVPTATDVDKDGDVDLIAAGWDRTVYSWDFQSPYNPEAAPWNGFHGNAWNDGNNSSKSPSAVIGASFAFDLRDGAVDLTWGLSPSAGYRFHLSRAVFEDETNGSFIQIARDLAVSPDGVLRYADSGVRQGNRYVYRIESAGNPNDFFETVPVYVAITRAELGQNYPNPFNPTTSIEYLVPDGDGLEVSLVVYDVRGARVRVLVGEVVRGGRYTAKWDGLNHNGARVSSGVYFYRLVTPGFSATRKMVMLK